MGLRSARWTPVRNVADQIVAGGNFVDFIDIDDSMLGQLDIPVGLAFDQVSKDQILHIPADITRLAEFGGVSFDKRHTDLLGDEPHHVGLAHAGWAQHQHVVLDDADHVDKVVRGALKMLDPVEVSTDFGGQRVLGCRLLNNVLVQISDQVLWLEIEIDRFAAFRWRFAFIAAGCLGHNDGRCQFHAATEFFGQEITQLFLQLLGVGNLFVVIAHNG